jgi:hypothetical protein
MMLWDRGLHLATEMDCGRGPYHAIIMVLVRGAHVTITMVCKKLTPWSRVLLEKLRVRSASQEIPRILWNPNVM